MNNSPLIDNLQYEYYTNSNKLKRVIDTVNDNNSKLGDFKYDAVGKGSIDYGYDYNGNLITDLNKKLNVHGYKHFSQVAATGEESVLFLDDLKRSTCLKFISDFEFDP